MEIPLFNSSIHSMLSIIYEYCSCIFRIQTKHTFYTLRRVNQNLSGLRNIQSLIICFKLYFWCAFISLFKNQLKALNQYDLNNISSKISSSLRCFCKIFKGFPQIVPYCKQHHNLWVHQGWNVGGVPHLEKFSQEKSQRGDQPMNIPLPRFLGLQISLLRLFSKR